MNLLLIGVLLALVAIAYQIGLSKSRNLAGAKLPTFFTGMSSTQECGDPKAVSR